MLGLHDEGDHPIVPVMLGDANIAQEMSKKLLDEVSMRLGSFFQLSQKEKQELGHKFQRHIQNKTLIKLLKLLLKQKVS